MRRATTIAIALLVFVVVMKLGIEPLQGLLNMLPAWLVYEIWYRRHR